MKSIKLRENFYWTGIIDDKLRVFDIIMYTEFGTTYNSYVMKAGDKTVLFETAKAKFFDEYLEKLKEVIDVHKIDYLVVSHTEPDHAGSVEMLLDLSPQMKIIATGCALGFLKEIVNKDFVGIPARDEEKMTIGNRTLRFMFVPNLHWPDTMYTFIEEEQILVTCDSFGSHYCLPEVVSTEIKNEADYQSALKYYYDCIIGPFKPYMIKALDRVEDMDISMICTGHGPVLVGDRIKAVMKQYREWSTVVNPNPGKTVIIPYVSAYGYTKTLAEKIAEGIRDSGDIDVRSYDMVEADAAKVSEELLFADGILLGTPTIVGEALKPIWDLTLGMFPGTHGGKFAGAFGSYGWSGEGVPHITERLKQLRMKVSEGFRVRRKPSEPDLVSAHEHGHPLGADGGAEAGVFDVAAGEHRAVAALQGGAHGEVGVGDVGPVQHGDGRGLQFVSGHGNAPFMKSGSVPVCLAPPSPPETEHGGQRQQNRYGAQGEEIGRRVPVGEMVLDLQ